LFDEDKKCLFVRFIADCGSAIKTMTAVSSDGKLHIAKTQRTAKKLGQRKRARNVRTE